MRHRAEAFQGGSCLCCAAHGLSCLITTTSGSVSRTLLFDTGPEDRVFEQNVSRLSADLASVESIVLSHGHWDHGGAMHGRFSLFVIAMAASQFLTMRIPTCFDGEPPR